MGEVLWYPNFLSILESALYFVVMKCILRLALGPLPLYVCSGMKARLKYHAYLRGIDKQKTTDGTMNPTNGETH